MPRESRTARDLAVRRERERGPSLVVIGITTSLRRQDFLKSLFPNPHHRVIFADGPNPELLDDDIVKVARHKVDTRLDPETPGNVRESYIGARNSCVIAADVRTRPLLLESSAVGQRLVPDRQPTTISLGKPKSLEDIRRTLGQMARAGEKGDVCYYGVETGTYLRKKGTTPQSAPDSTTAYLDKDRIAYYSTPRGFVDYVRGFHEFYSVEGSETPNITDIAGGLSLGTLLSRGAVLSIDGIAATDSGFRGAVKIALHKVLFGFNIGILRRLKPNIREFIDGYGLLERYTSLAMAEPQRAISKKR